MTDAQELHRRKLYETMLFAASIIIDKARDAGILKEEIAAYDRACDAYFDANKPDDQLFKDMANVARIQAEG